MIQSFRVRDQKERRAARKKKEKGKKGREERDDSSPLVLLLELFSLAFREPALLPGTRKEALKEEGEGGEGGRRRAGQ